MNRAGLGASSCLDDAERYQRVGEGGGNGVEELTEGFVEIDEESIEKVHTGFFLLVGTGNARAKHLSLLKH